MGYRGLWCIVRCLVNDIALLEYARGLHWVTRDRRSGLIPAKFQFSTAYIVKKHFPKLNSVIMHAKFR